MERCCEEMSREKRLKSIIGRGIIIMMFFHLIFNPRDLAKKHREVVNLMAQDVDEDVVGLAKT